MKSSFYLIPFTTVLVDNVQNNSIVENETLMLEFQNRARPTFTKFGEEIINEKKKNFSFI